MTEFSDARKIATLLAAIAEPTRLRVLWLLAKGPEHVGRLAELVNIPMVNMSHHLGVMRQSGLLEDEKEGRRVVYKLRPGIFAAGTTPEILGTLTLGHYRVVLRTKSDGPVPSGSGKGRRKSGK